MDFSEGMFREIWDNSNDGYVLLNENREFIYSNQAFKSLLKSADEIHYNANEFLNLSPEKILDKLRADKQDFLLEFLTEVFTNQENEFKILGQERETISISRKNLSSGKSYITFQRIKNPEQNTSHLEHAVKVALLALADLAEFRDPQTGDHVFRVARMTHEIAKELKRTGEYEKELSEVFLRHIGLASILHDIGKVSIPDSILFKPDKLTPEERAIMERHTTDGGVILLKANHALGDSVHFRLAAEITEYHHEFWNGQGYPTKLSGEDIPLSARIVAVADVFDALSEKRPYKEAWALEEVKSYILDKSGIQFDPKIVDAFLEVIRKRERAKKIAWSVSMSVSFEEMDHDHRILLELINLVINEENRYDKLSVEFIMDELVNYSLSHFRREEKLMEKFNYPNLRSHRVMHERMYKQVKELQKKIIFDFTPFVGDEISVFLKSWLSDHILNEDMKYSNFVKGLYASTID